MKNIRSDPLLLRQAQLERLRRIMQQELTPLQMDTLQAYYFQQKSLSQIARERNVNKSTVCRTLHRALKKLKRFGRYLSP